MKASLRGEIVDVEVEAEYRGSVYERTITLRAGSTVLACYQDNSYVTDEDLGEIVDLRLLAQPLNRFEVFSPTDKNIVQAETTNRETSKWHTTIIGEVLGVEDEERVQNTEDRFIVLDVGLGTVLVSPNQELMDLVDNRTTNSKLMVQIETGRLDIVGRHNGD